MGFPTVRFVKSVDPNLICGICSGVLDSPNLTPCGHTFCESCIKTWLDTATVSTCPECRSDVNKRSLRSILSLRNFIYSLEVTCPNKSRGCNETVKIDSQDAHQSLCLFETVACQSCHRNIAQSQLEEHQRNCISTNSFVTEKEASYNLYSPDRAGHFHGSDAKGDSNTCLVNSRMFSRNSYREGGSDHITYLLQRIGILEKQVSKLLDDLHESHRKNSRLQYQNQQLMEGDAVRQRSLVDRPSTSSRSCEYNIVSQQDIAKLSLHIARYLLKKPTNVDRDNVFHTIRKCYDMQFRHLGINSKIDHDIHMLLATAYSSNWFTPAQRILLGCWLQCVLKNQENN